MVFNVKKTSFSVSLVISAGCIVLSSCTKKPIREDFAYTIIDASSSKRPSFTENEDAFDKGEYRYFVGSSENVSKALCQKGARSNASEKVSEEIVRNVTDEYVRDVSNTDTIGDGGKINSALNSTEIQKIKHYTETRLGGIGNEQSYWEQRRYKVAMGALQDKQQFNCYAVVKVKKSIIENFVKEVNKEFKLSERANNNGSNNSAAKQQDNG